LAVDVAEILGKQGSYALSSAALLSPARRLRSDWWFHPRSPAARNFGECPVETGSGYRAVAQRALAETAVWPPVRKNIDELALRQPTALCHQDAERGADGSRQPYLLAGGD